MKTTRTKEMTYICTALPTLLSDVRGRLEELAASSPDETDPFDSIYKLVYLLTQRAVGATEIAENRQLLDETRRLFEQIESTTTPSQVMFPWLPSPTLMKRYIAGGKMYMIFQKIVVSRQKSEKRIDDPLQFLLDQGDDMTKIISVSNISLEEVHTNVTSSWLVHYLLVN